MSEFVDTLSKLEEWLKSGKASPEVQRELGKLFYRMAHFDETRALIIKAVMIIDPHARFPNG